MELYVAVSLLWASLIMLLGIPGNLLILYVYLKKKNRTSAHIFILALATCDIIACLILPLRMYGWINEFTFVNENLCKATLSVRFLCNFLELFLIGALTVDRFSAVTDPAKRFNQPQAVSVIGVCTFLSATISLPPITIFGINQETSSCEILGPVWAGDLFYTFEMVCYVLLFIAIVILSILIYIAAYKARRRAIAREALETTSSFHIKRAWSTANPADDSDISICVLNRPPSRIPIRKSSTLKPHSKSDVLVTGVSLVPSAELDIITASIPSRPPSHQLPPVHPTHPNALPDLSLPNVPSLPSIPEIPGTVPSTSGHQYSRHMSQQPPRPRIISSQSSHSDEIAPRCISSQSTTSADNTKRRQLVSSLTKTLLVTCMVTLLTWIPTLVIFITHNLLEPLRTSNINLYSLVVLGRHFGLMCFSMKAVLYAIMNRYFYKEAAKVMNKLNNWIC